MAETILIKFKVDVPEPISDYALRLLLTEQVFRHPGSSNKVQDVKNLYDFIKEAEPKEGKMISS